MADEITVKDAAIRLKLYLEQSRPTGLASWRSTLFDLDWIANQEGDAPLPMHWRNMPVTAGFLADVFDSYSGADSHNLVAAKAQSRSARNHRGA